jgi:maleylacetoacetate isomerase
MGQGLKLYSYWRSSASYRVRIALNLKGLQHEIVPVNLLTGEHNSGDFDTRNPQHMVPVLMHGERVMRQSLAIIEWLEESYEGRGYHLLARPPRDRVRLRGIAHMIASDVAPLNVLRILHYLEREFQCTDSAKRTWMLHWMQEGFEALEKMLDNPSTGAFCEGDEPTMADCCLIPQIYNAKRWQMDLTPYPKMLAIYDTCMAMEEFQAAAPERQIDAPVAAAS